MKQKQILILVISFFAIVVIWVGFSIYHSFVNSTISEKLNISIQPINPDFDIATINKIKARKEYSPLYEMEVTKEEAPISTQSGQQSIPEKEVFN